MASKFLAVIWDMDGTLVDTESLHESSLKQACQTYGLTYPAKTAHPVVGLSLDQLWILLGGPEQASLSYEGWIEKINDKYEEKVTPDLLRPNIVKVLESLKQSKMALACASNAQREVLDANLKNTGIMHYFQHTVARNDVTEGKPAPAPYLLAAKKINIDPALCIAVEDTPIGIAAARAAGMTAVAFPNSLTKDMDFSQAQYVFEDIIDILTLF